MYLVSASVTLFRQLEWSQPTCLQFSDKRQGNLSIRTNHHGAREIGFAPNPDVQNIFGADQVLVRINCSRRGLATARRSWALRFDDVWLCLTDCKGAAGKSDEC